MRAQEWMFKYLRNAERLDNEVLEAISDFCLMWGLFEGAECDGNAGKAKFEQFADRVFSHIDEFVLLNLLEYWKERYVEGTCTNNRFEALHWRLPHDAKAKEISKNILEGNSSAPRDMVICILSIVHRLRNNLFHGLKTIDMLNGQVANFREASKALQELMPFSGRYIYLDAVA